MVDREEEEKEAKNEKEGKQRRTDERCKAKMKKRVGSYMKARERFGGSGWFMYGVGAARCQAWIMEHE